MLIFPAHVFSLRFCCRLTTLSLKDTVKTQHFRRLILFVTPHPHPCPTSDAPQRCYFIEWYPRFLSPRKPEATHILDAFVFLSSGLVMDSRQYLSFPSMALDLHFHLPGPPTTSLAWTTAWPSRLYFLIHSPIRSPHISCSGIFPHTTPPREQMLLHLCLHIFQWVPRIW